MGAKASHKQKFEATTQELQHAVEYALQQANARKQMWSSDKRRVATRILTGLWSWGENVDITIYDGGVVEISSACVSRFQIIDWGKNRTNVERIVNGIGEYLTRNQMKQPG